MKASFGGIHRSVAGVVLVLGLGVMTARLVAAQSDEEFEAKLGYQTGTIALGGGMATLQLPPSFRFLTPAGSARLLERWGNPPGAAEGVLGMLIPTAVSPIAEGGWGIVLTYDDDGFVNDDDAASIDYRKMLSEMQSETRDGNDARKENGFEPITLVGWAEPPHYDGQAHKLYWAKELAFGSAPEHTLNYNIRILGRRGVLVMNAVAGMGQLAAVRAETPAVLAAVEFNDGHRYTDYLPSSDKAAAYGIGGLIAGATAAKAGLFKLLWIGLLASKKLLLAGVVALVAAAKRFFGGKNSSTDAVA